VTNRNTNNISILDAPQSLNDETILSVGSSPVGIAVNPSTNCIYVSNNGSNTRVFSFDVQGLKQ
jgi:DNA-binding beta-propeller fold protein YncE